MTKLKRSFQWTGLFFAALFLVQGTAHAKRFRATLKKVADGDTATVVDTNGKVHKIRFLGMDTPELHFENEKQSPWAEQATDRLLEMLNSTEAVINRHGQYTSLPEDRDTGKPVKLEVQVDGKDHYGRELGYLFYDDVNLNLQLTKEGWASPYLYCSYDKKTKRACGKNWIKEAMVADFVAACESARKKGLGVFDPKNPIPETPGEFRRRIRVEKHNLRREAEEALYYQHIGDFKTKKLYAPLDESKVDECNRIRFDRPEDAKALGFKP